MSKDKITPRGFRHAPRRSGSYGGYAKVYESSAASGPHLWVLSQDHMGNEAIVHMTDKQARKFAKDILRLSKHHYQKEPR